MMIAYRPPMFRVALVLNWLLLVSLLAGGFSCGANQRTRTIKATYIAVNAARDGFDTYDAEHQAEIVARATSFDEGTRQLNAYQAQQAKMLLLFEAAYRTIAAAATASDSQSLKAMQATAKELAQAVAAFIKGISP